MSPSHLVIGAGLGGLACAAELARAGRDVLVLERGSGPGGYASCFERGPYRFDASLHLLDAVEPGEPNRAVWQALGLADSVRLRRPAPLRRECWPGLEFDVPQGLDGWVRTLAGLFPGEREGLRQLRELAERVHGDHLADRDTRLAGGPPRPLSSTLAGLVDRTAGGLLRELFQDVRCRAAVGSLSCYLGVGRMELAAIPFLSMLASYQGHGGTYPLGGSGAIAEALARTVERRGGRIRTDAAVVDIRAERGRVRGVRLQGGEELDADVVVSNLSPERTFAALLPPTEGQGRYLRRLQAMRPSTSAVKLWLGLDRDPASLGPLAYELFVRTSFTSLSEDDYCQVATHLLDPSCCPAGHGVLSLTVSVEAEQGQGASGREDRIDRVLRRAEARLPGLRDAVSRRAFADPAVFERHSGCPGGQIHGFRPIPRQSGPRRPSVRTPVDGLFQVGGWVYAGSGCLPSMTSGLVAAVEVVERRG